MSKKILIVDDEPRYVRLMEANLISDNYEVLKAYNGQQALEIVEDQKPDLVLLDVMMPVLDGFTTCERIRKFSTVPIIMVTVKGEEKDRVRGLDLGADDYIVKPFSATELLARVRAVFDGLQNLLRQLRHRYFIMATWISIWRRQKFFLVERWCIYRQQNTGYFFSWRRILGR